MMERIYTDHGYIVVIDHNGTEIYREKENSITREEAHEVYCSEHF